jgi:hypothetical protein
VRTSLQFQAPENSQEEGGSHSEDPQMLCPENVHPCTEEYMIGCVFCVNEWGQRVS